MRIRIWAAALFLSIFFMTGRSTAETVDASAFIQMAAARELPSGLSAKAKLALGPTKSKLIAGDTAAGKAAFGKWLEANKKAQLMAQDALQAESQKASLLSTMSKSIHEMAKSIIQNIKA